MIGIVELGRIDRRNCSGRISRFLLGDEINRTKGTGYKVANLLLDIGFGELKLHRISLGVFDFNLPAIRCYEKAGFKREGLLRDFRKVKDNYWNLVEMSILHDEGEKKKSLH